MALSQTLSKIATGSLYALCLGQALALDTIIGLTAGSQLNVSKADFNGNNPSVPYAMTFSSGSSSLFLGTFAGIKRFHGDYLVSSYQIDAGYDSLNNEMLSLTSAGASAPSTIITAKTGFYYGLSSRFGIARGDYSLYLISGLKSGQWTKTVENKSDTVSQAIPPASKKDFITTPINALIGIGMHLVLNDSTNGLFEYQYILPSNYNKNSFDSDGYQASWSTKLSQQAVSFSLIY